MTLRILHALPAAAAAAVLLAACKGGSPQKSDTAADHDFKLLVLKKRWGDMNLGYDYDRAFLRLKSSAPGNVLYTIGAGKIDSYDWKRQAITLTAGATDALTHALAGDKGVEPGIEALGDLKKKAGMSNALELSLYTRGFLVTSSGEALYGGIFLDAMSQMAINYPVIRVGIDGDRAVLAILPIHIPFMTRDPAAAGTLESDGVVAKEAAEDWNQVPRQVKTGLVGKLATGKQAKAFRALIKDPAIREAMDDAGKLR
jgi:hypothetical protein